MIVLGIDPGTAVTGYGVVRGDGRGMPSLVECGVIRTAARSPLPDRLLEIHDGVTELLARHRPDMVGVEGVFYARNVRTTVVLGHARGVILLAARQAGVAVHELSPAEIKNAVVGTGAASKSQVQYMLTRLLRLKAVPSPSDAADGIAAALTCLLGAHMSSINSRAASLNAPAPRVRRPEGAAAARAVAARAAAASRLVAPPDEDQS